MRSSIYANENRMGCNWNEGVFANKVNRRLALYFHYYLGRHIKEITTSSTHSRRRATNYTRIFFLSTENTQSWQYKKTDHKS